jgi:hypothetical protein
MAANELARGVTFAALDPALFIPTMALVGALLVGAVVVVFVRRWQQLQRRPLSTSASDQLAQFRALHEQGRISEDEFKRLRAVLSEEIRKENDLPPPAVAVASAQPPSPASSPAPGGPPPETKEPPPTDTGIRPA